MLELKQICFGYQKNNLLVRNVSLKVNDGEFIAVAGRNGSGKTTLTKLIMGLLKPASGQVLLNGSDVTGLGADRMARQVGYVFQNPDRQMFRDSVAQEVAYGPEQLGFAPVDLKMSVNEALEMTDLTALADQYPRSLSKGQKQRVAIASALAMKPRLLILDEPTSGQDAGQREQLMGVLTRLNRQGMTVLLVTHDMEIMMRYTSRAWVMADGHLVFDGEITQLFDGSYPLSPWGLGEPSAVRISRELREFGLTPAYSVEELQTQLQPLLRRRNGNETHGAAH